MTLAQEETIVFKSTKDGNRTTTCAKREFHDEKDSTYWLPKDEDEQKRLTGQHFAIKELFGGNVLNRVRKALDFEKGVSVLDIGCGSGIWIKDMIRDYPNCVYHGCDIVDATRKLLRCDQFHFTYGNVVKGLPYADDTFDFVHMRLLVYALRAEEWPMAIQEVIRVVRPGGMIQLYEGGLEIPNDTSVYYKFANAVTTLSVSRGQNPRIAWELEDLVSIIDKTNILQVEQVHCQLNSSADTSKTFIWVMLELAKGAFSSLGPIIGLDEEHSLLDFLNELEYCMSHEDCYLYGRTVAVKKL